MALSIRTAAMAQAAPGAPTLPGFTSHSAPARSASRAVRLPVPVVTAVGAIPDVVTDLSPDALAGRGCS